MHTHIEQKGKNVTVASRNFVRGAKVHISHLCTHKLRSCGFEGYQRWWTPRWRRGEARTVNGGHTPPFPPTPTPVQAPCPVPSRIPGAGG